MTATLDDAGDGSLSDVLGTLYGTEVRRGTTAQPVSDAECRALVSAMTLRGPSSLDGSHVVLYRVETSGRQTHVFAAYDAALILPGDPDVVTVGEDLVYVFDAGYTLLFYTLPTRPDAR